MYELTTYHGPDSSTPSDDGSYPTLVLAEEGHEMWLTVVSFCEPPQPGVTFRFLDQEWEIVWRESAGCGAVPRRGEGSVK